MEDFPWESLNEHPLRLSQVTRPTRPIYPPYDFTGTTTHLDLIELEYKEINMQQYINENKDNIVIAYRVNHKNKYFLTTLSHINSEMTNLLVYPCPRAGSMSVIKTDIPLINLRTLGIDYTNQFCDIRDIILQHGAPLRGLVHAQTFAIEDTDIRYPAFVSHNVAYENGSHVSGLHCQRGYGSKISKIVVSGEEASGEEAYDLEYYKEKTLYAIFLLIFFLGILERYRILGGDGIIISKTTHSRGKTKSKSKRTSVISRNDNRSLISSIKMMIMAVIDNNDIGRQKIFAERLKNILEKNGVDVKGIETSSNRFWSNKPTLMNQTRMNLLIQSVEREHGEIKRPPLETLKKIIHELVETADEILINKDGVIHFNDSVKKDFIGYTPTSRVTQHKMGIKKLTGGKKTRKYKKKSMKPKNNK